MHEKRALQHEWQAKHQNEKETARQCLSLFKKVIRTTQNEGYLRFYAWRDCDKRRRTNLASVICDTTRNYFNY